ncbi:Uncharacterized protein dnm_006490 [Desulfonema magnum]|uniref:Uncharacterized protein n=1 Tax=Desulfonema magnum TaxID=45655 RepID=A0A975BG40_9BACT|nr:Uncharacterized protein dnm_006490 [Desulfonema magnum]
MTASISSNHKKSSESRKFSLRCPNYAMADPIKFQPYDLIILKNKNKYYQQLASNMPKI